jgi:hypothetical protein
VTVEASRARGAGDRRSLHLLAWVADVPGAGAGVRHGQGEILTSAVGVWPCQLPAVTYLPGPSGRKISQVISVARRLVPPRRPGDPCLNMTPFALARHAGLTGPCTVPPGVGRTQGPNPAL